MVENKLMESMDISNEGYGPGEFKTDKPNLLTNEAMVEVINQVFRDVDSAICHTIGPYGGNVLMQDYYDLDVPLYPTRDGYTIMDHISYAQTVPDSIFMIIKEISKYMQFNIGDSTSSGIPIASCLYRYLTSVYSSDINKVNEGWKFSPVSIKNLLAIITEVVIEGITDNPLYQIKLSAMKSDEDRMDILTRLATISANNDYGRGKFVADLFKDKLDGTGSVQVHLSKTAETTTKISDSFDITSGLVDYNVMVNDSTKSVCNLDKPNVAIFEFPLMEADIPALNEIIKSSYFDNGQPLVIIAPSFTRPALNHILKCIRGEVFTTDGEMYGQVEITESTKPCKIPMACNTLARAAEEIRNFELADLIVMTNATVFLNEMGLKFPEGLEGEELSKYIYNHFGKCSLYSGGYQDSYFHGCQPDETVKQARIKELEENLKSKQEKYHQDDFITSSIEVRIAKLVNKTSIIYVGGNSKEQKYADKLVYDDAVSAVKVAIEEDGVSIGGNIAISHYIEHNADELINKIGIKINETGKNITAGSTDAEEIKDFINELLDGVKYSFGQAYRYALYNMYQNSEKSLGIWNSLLSHSTPTIYNIDTARNESFIPYDENGEYNRDDGTKLTTIIVPKDTDKCLLTICTSTIATLINTMKMITIAYPDIDLKQIHVSSMMNGLMRPTPMMNG